MVFKSKIIKKTTTKQDKTSPDLCWLKKRLWKPWPHIFFADTFSNHKHQKWPTILRSKFSIQILGRSQFPCVEYMPCPFESTSFAIDLFTPGECRQDEWIGDYQTGEKLWRCGGCGGCGVDDAAMGREETLTWRKVLERNPSEFRLVKNDFPAVFIQFHILHWHTYTQIRKLMAPASNEASHS